MRTTLWSMQFGTPGFDFGTHLAIDNSANLYLAGATTGSLYGPHDTSLYCDAFLAKMSDSGSTIWNKQIDYGSSSNDTGFCVRTDSLGNSVLKIGRGVMFDDLMTIKFDPSGTELWSLQLGGMTQRDHGLSIDTNNNIFLAGDTYRNLFGTVIGGIDIFVVKYGSDGTIINQ